MIVFLNVILIICMFVMGSLFGSFFSLATYRLPRHQDIIATRSYCPNCKHRLNFFDLIPVFSFIFLGDKCRYCKQKISPRYFLLEVSNGLLLVILYLIFGYTIKLAIIWIIYSFIFVIIGAKIMETKMSYEEKKEVEKMKLSKKSGVFISELVIAIVLFAILMISVFTISRNYTKNATETILKSNANVIAVKNLEMCLATKYDKLASYTLQEKFQDVTYSVNVKVDSVSDTDFSKKDIVKKVEVEVSYMQNGVKKTQTISTLKGKV